MKSEIEAECTKNASPPSISLLTTKMEVLNNITRRSTRSGDISVTSDTHFVCNPVDNPFKMAFKTSSHKHIQGGQIAFFGPKMESSIPGTVRFIRKTCRLPKREQQKSPASPCLPTDRVITSRNSEQTRSFFRLRPTTAIYHETRRLFASRKAEMSSGLNLVLKSWETLAGRDEEAGPNKTFVQIILNVRPAH